MSGVATSIATVCLSGTLAEKLDAVAAAGFDGVEVFEPDLVASPLSATQIRERARTLGLTIDLYQPFRDVDSTDPAQFERNLARAEAKFDVMSGLGCDLMLVCSSPLPTAVRDDAVLVTQLRTLAERAQRRGIRLAYEALAWGTHVNTYWHSWEIVRAVDHPSLGLCLDSFHVLSRGDDPDRIADIPGDKIFFVQWADSPAMAMDVLQWSRHHRNFPGQGSFDLRRFAVALQSSGYRGPWSLEIFNDTFRAGDPVRTARDGLRSLRFLQDSAHCVGDDLFTAPDVEPLGDVVSVRIAAGPGKSSTLQSVLGALGFVPAGRHRDYDLQLWRQGQLTVVVDASPGTVWTAPGLPAHLPALTQIGIRSDDPASWARRAHALAVPADSVGLPGVEPDDAVARVEVTGTTSVDVRAPSSAASWGAAFVPVPGVRTATSVPVLTGVDHVGIAVPDDEWDSVILLLRSVFGMEPHDEPDITDAVGLMRNRSVIAPAGSSTPFRLTLGMVTGLAASTFGTARRGGIGHVAFSCDDIFTAAAAMRRRGFTALPIPSNYYDDLAARFGLPGELLAQMAASGILYDRDADGEFFHLFTPTLGADLFFEVVQRVGGYRGFGDANAAVRIAAQPA
ncbi:sugar phosphate isomerase/epimerase and 4-hydroxyphenylpyruvate domain-containing protein [Gordonia sp. TBRC 11910]|uniref:3-dehydroshikimate dehydratase n=1 Tax=Gordonia asplenii TaxID=2725283 RepID=A0A848KWH1_9ACTN|nr:sugar phosphate isomerase/epimerase and 4-hydroxyphenylpyruvate domain-containing protein [Gordonia asplenii]NMO03006.1 sugar phosphate isomerase/epimerase and 4-hydroxyphenylpyruvate domain-containing protein [Gordonia asplenii]